MGQDDTEVRPSTLDPQVRCPVCGQGPALGGAPGGRHSRVRAIGKASRWRHIRRATELLSLVSIAISLPLGLYHLRREQAKETDLLAQKAYDDLDERYIDFQKLCMQYPHLDCYDRPLPTTRPLTADEKVQQKYAYTILLSMFERAYLDYQCQEVPTRQEQWKGWDDSATSFMARPAFREVWFEVGGGYDLRFQAYMNKKLPVAPK